MRYASEADRLIWEKFHIKPHDSLPFTGWTPVTREILPELFRELGYKVGAEVGVAQGTFSRLLCQEMPGLKLTCVDPWVEYSRGRISQRVCDQRYRMAVRRLTPYGCDIKRMTSLAASAGVADGSLDFVYIDGGHEFDNIMLDLILWAPKVRLGGIVSGHDYYAFYQSGVVKAVNAYTEEHQIRQWYLTKEESPSFLWVRQ